MNLDVATPEDVATVLERAADHYRDSAAELVASWGDRTAGKVWEDFATILERAAASCRTAIRNRLG
jgi:hypothetical protein